MLLVTSQRRHSRRSESLLGTDFCQTKVQNLGLASMSHEDVRRLDVAVDDVRAMCRIERIGHFDAQIDQRRYVHWLPANALPKGPAFQQLHRDEVLAFMFRDVVYRVGVWMA